MLEDVFSLKIQIRRFEKKSQEGQPIRSCWTFGNQLFGRFLTYIIFQRVRYLTYDGHLTDAFLVECMGLSLQLWGRGKAEERR